MDADIFKHINQNIVLGSEKKRLNACALHTINKDPDQSTHMRWLNRTLVSSMFLRTINEDPD